MPLLTHAVAVLGIHAFLLAGIATPQTARGPILVELWHRGDDGLTLRLVDNLVNVFKASPKFTLSGGQKPGTLIVGIPTHVGWRVSNQRTEVDYVVEFSSTDGTLLMRSNGSCWDGALDKCSVQIIRDALIAARKIQ